ncbi:mucin-3B-like [Macrobrachium nipponense]|uniref:mucin-3B-like n=1 Tax=Macrobrachium nipponense TaxID=159736 RepID=UPI0030C8C5A5
MQPKTSSVAVIIFIGCSASSMAWPLDNKPLATENTSHENLTETLRGRQRDIDTASFFPADERWLKVDEQRWSHLVKRAEPEPAQREREARKRPYIPLNSLTFMTANNEVAPIDWYSQNDTDIRQQIAASKLAGYRKPSDQKTSTSTSLYKPENSTSTDVTPNKFLLFYTTTKKSLPQHDIFPEPSKHPTTHITPSTGIYSSTFREPSLATPSPPKSNSFLSGSKLITFIPVLVSTTPPPYRISTPTSSSNASGLQSTLESLHQHLTNSSRTPSFEYTTKRSAILTLMDKVMANPSAADTTTELHSTTSAYPLTSTKLPPHAQTEEIVTWPSSKAPNITDGYFTAQYFLEANFPKRNSSHFGDKNTTGLEITYKKPSVNHQVQRPNFSDINRLGNSSVSSFSNSTTTPTSAPLTIVDQLVLHEAFNRLKNQEELLSPLQNANSTLPTVYSQQVTFIEEPSVVGLSESAQTAVTEKDEDWSLGYTKITETEPTTDWVTSPEPSSTPEPPEISTSISSGTSSPYYVQVTPLATKIAASPIYYSHSLLLPNQSGTSETKTAQQQPLPQKADGNDSIKPAVDLTTVPSQPAGDTTVSDYEYDFFEDDLSEYYAIYDSYYEQGNFHDPNAGLTPPRFPDLQTLTWPYTRSQTTRSPATLDNLPQTFQTQTESIPNESYFPESQIQPNFPSYTSTIHSSLPDPTFSPNILYRPFMKIFEFLGKVSSNGQHQTSIKNESSNNLHSPKVTYTLSNTPVTVSNLLPAYESSAQKITTNTQNLTFPNSNYASYSTTNFDISPDKIDLSEITNAEMGQHNLVSQTQQDESDVKVNHIYNPFNLHNVGFLDTKYSPIHTASTTTSSNTHPPAKVYSSQNTIKHQNTGGLLSDINTFAPLNPLNPIKSSYKFNTYREFGTGTANDPVTEKIVNSLAFQNLRHTTNQPSSTSHSSPLQKRSTINPIDTPTFPPHPSLQEENDFELSKNNNISVLHESQKDAQTMIHSKTQNFQDTKLLQMNKTDFLIKSADNDISFTFKTEDKRKLNQAQSIITQEYETYYNHILVDSNSANDQLLPTKTPESWSSQTDNSLVQVSEKFRNTSLEVLHSELSKPTDVAAIANMSPLPSFSSLLEKTSPDSYNTAFTTPIATTSDLKNYIRPLLNLPLDQQFYYPHLLPVSKDYDSISNSHVPASKTNSNKNYELFFVDTFQEDNDTVLVFSNTVDIFRCYFKSSNPDNINPMNLSRSNTEHYSDVMVRVWEMEGGQLNLVNEQPVPIEMFQNTSLTNGAVVNPQDVPTKVMAMVSSTAQVNHPLLNPESYLHTRRRRSSQNFTDDDPNDILLNLKSSSTTMEHPKDNVSSYTNHSVNSLTENEPTLFNDRLEEFRDHQEYMPHNSSSNINSNVSLLHTIMPHLVGHLSSSYHTFLQRLGQNPEAAQSQTNENNLFTIAATAGRNMDGNVPNVHHFNAATHFKKQSENHFGGVGNPDHSNLPLAIGTALQESDINYLQTLYKFANLLADSSNTQPTIQSYLKTLSQSPGPNQTPSRLPLTKHDLNNDSNLKPDVEELAAAQRTDAHQSQENSNSQYGSVLEFLPPELPHINPLLASNEASGYNPVDLGKVITSLPSSSTLIREQLKSTLAAVTGTNTFSGHLGNQGYVSHNSHATQNSISGNNEQAYIPQESQHSEEGISSFLAQRHFQSSVPTSIDEAYYPYAHQTESNPSNDHEFSLLNLLQGSTFQGQQRPNIQDATFTNFHDVPSQTQFQNLGQQDSLLNSAFVNQIEQQRPSAMAELGLQQPFLANSNTDSHNKLPGALLSDAALFSSNNLLGISNYPTPLLDFIFQNMSANNFQPQEIGLRIPQIQASEPVGSFNPTDPYIPALDSSILGEPNVANPTNLLPESSASITPVLATFTSGSGSSVANCQKNAGCILGLAGLASLGISKALLLPFFLGRRRRRRHSPNLTSPHIENLKAAADFHPLFPNSINQDSFTKDTLMDDITKINHSSINAPQDNDQPDILVKLLASKRNMPKEREPLEDLFYRLPENLQLTFMKYTLEVLSQREKTHSTTCIQECTSTYHLKGQQNSSSRPEGIKASTPLSHQQKIPTVTQEHQATTLNLWESPTEVANTKQMKLTTSQHTGTKSRPQQELFNSTVSSEYYVQSLPVTAHHHVHDIPTTYSQEDSIYTTVHTLNDNYAYPHATCQTHAAKLQDLKNNYTSEPLGETSSYVTIFEDTESAFTTEPQQNVQTHATKLQDLKTNYTSEPVGETSSYVTIFEDTESAFTTEPQQHVQTLATKLQDLKNNLTSEPLGETSSYVTIFEDTKPAFTTEPQQEVQTFATTSSLSDISVSTLKQSELLFNQGKPHLLTKLDVSFPNSQTSSKETLYSSTMQSHADNITTKPAYQESSTTFAFPNASNFKATALFLYHVKWIIYTMTQGDVVPTGIPNDSTLNPTTETETQVSISFSGSEDEVSSYSQYTEYNTIGIPAEPALPVLNSLSGPHNHESDSVLNPQQSSTTLPQGEKILPHQTTVFTPIKKNGQTTASFQADSSESEEASNYEGHYDTLVTNEKESYHVTSPQSHITVSSLKHQQLPNSFVTLKDTLSPPTKRPQVLSPNFHLEFGNSEFPSSKKPQTTTNENMISHFQEVSTESSSYTETFEYRPPHTERPAYPTVGSVLDSHSNKPISIVETPQYFSSHVKLDGELLHQNKKPGSHSLSSTLNPPDKTTEKYPTLNKGNQEFTSTTEYKVELSSIEGTESFKPQQLFNSFPTPKETLSPPNLYEATTVPTHTLQISSYDHTTKNSGLIPSSPPHEESTYFGSVEYSDHDITKEPPSVSETLPLPLLKSQHLVSGHLKPKDKVASFIYKPTQHSYVSEVEVHNEEPSITKEPQVLQEKPNYSTEVHHLLSSHSPSIQELFNHADKNQYHDTHSSTILYPSTTNSPFKPINTTSKFQPHISSFIRPLDISSTSTSSSLYLDITSTSEPVPLTSGSTLSQHHTTNSLPQTQVSSSISHVQDSTNRPQDDVDHEKDYTLFISSSRPQQIGYIDNPSPEYHNISPSLKPVQQRPDSDTTNHQYRVDHSHKPQPNIPNYTQSSHKPLPNIPDYTQSSHKPQPNIPNYTQLSHRPQPNIPDYTQSSYKPQPSIPDYAQFSNKPQPNIPDYTQFSHKPQPNIPDYTQSHSVNNKDDQQVIVKVWNLVDGQLQLSGSQKVPISELEKAGISLNTKSTKHDDGNIYYFNADDITDHKNSDVSINHSYQEGIKITTLLPSRLDETTAQAIPSGFTNLPHELGLNANSPSNLDKPSTTQLLDKDSSFLSTHSSPERFGNKVQSSQSNYQDDFKKLLQLHMQKKEPLLDAGHEANLNSNLQPNITVNIFTTSASPVYFPSASQQPSLFTTPSLPINNQHENLVLTSEIHKPHILHPLSSSKPNPTVSYGPPLPVGYNFYPPAKLDHKLDISSPTYTDDSSNSNSDSSFPDYSLAYIGEESDSPSSTSALHPFPSPLNANTNRNTVKQGLPFLQHNPEDIYNKGTGIAKPPVIPQYNMPNSFPHQNIPYASIPHTNFELLKQTHVTNPHPQPASFSQSSILHNFPNLNEPTHNAGVSYVLNDTPQNYDDATKRVTQTSKAQQNLNFKLPIIHSPTHEASSIYTNIPGQTYIINPTKEYNSLPLHPLYHNYFPGTPVKEPVFSSFIPPSRNGPSSSNGSSLGFFTVSTKAPVAMATSVNDYHHNFPQVTEKTTTDHYVKPANELITSEPSPTTQASLTSSLIPQNVVTDDAKTNPSPMLPVNLNKTHNMTSTPVTENNEKPSYQEPDSKNPQYLTFDNNSHFTNKQSLNTSEVNYQQNLHLKQAPIILQSGHKNQENSSSSQQPTLPPSAFGGIGNPALLGIPIDLQQNNGYAAPTVKPKNSKPFQAFGGVGNDALENYPLYVGGNFDKTNDPNRFIALKNNNPLIQNRPPSSSSSTSNSATSQVYHPQITSGQVNNSLNPPGSIFRNYDQILSDLQELETLEALLVELEAFEPQTAETIRLIAIESILARNPSLVEYLISSQTNIQESRSEPESTERTEYVRSNENKNLYNSSPMYDIPPELLKKFINIHIKNQTRHTNIQKDYTKAQSNMEGPLHSLIQGTGSTPPSLVELRIALQQHLQHSIPLNTNGNNSENHTVNITHYAPVRLPVPATPSVPATVLVPQTLPSVLAVTTSNDNLSSEISLPTEQVSDEAMLQCLRSMWCSFGLALTVGVGAASAVAAPFVTPALGRKRREVAEGPVDDTHNYINTSNPTVNLYAALAKDLMNHSKSEDNEREDGQDFDILQQIYQEDMTGVVKSILLAFNITSELYLPNAILLNMFNDINRENNTTKQGLEDSHNFDKLPVSHSALDVIDSHIENQVKQNSTSHLTSILSVSPVKDVETTLHTTAAGSTSTTKVVPKAKKKGDQCSENDGCSIGVALAIAVVPFLAAPLLRKKRRRIVGRERLEDDLTLDEIFPPELQSLLPDLENGLNIHKLFKQDVSASSMPANVSNDGN